MSWRPRDSVSGGLADECTAFLTGRYAEYAHDVGWLVPTWAWLNELGHRSPEEVALLASGRRPRKRISHPWTTAVDELAAEAVALARTRDLLSLVQRQVLVPLELALAARGEELDPDSFKAIARLPGRDALNAQLAGVVASNAAGESVTKQTRDVLSTIDGHLKKAGSDKSKLLTATT